jgi:hypothetical protein
MWYNHLCEYLIKEGYKNDSICPCIFRKRSRSEFVIKVVYVNDVNLISTPQGITEAKDCLKKEFEMKDLGKTMYCLSLQIEHLKDGVLLHQATYIKKILKQFYMDKAHPLSTLMVVRSLDVIKDPFWPPECDSEILGPEVPYLSSIGALMYLSTHTQPDIAFAIF